MCEVSDEIETSAAAGGVGGGDDVTIVVPAGAGDDGNPAVEPIEIQSEMEQSFLDYAMSVIVSRALPDARDGLKPVHRRILWGMFDAGFRPGSGHVKCSRVVGDVMGNYHPHGDQAAAPWAWPPTSRPTTSVRCVTRSTT